MLALAAGNAAVCAGWMPTPEARMACCSDTCPMHESDSGQSGSGRAVTQAEADSCCAESERDDAAPSASVFVLTVPLAALTGPVPFVIPDFAASEAWRTHVPVPGTRVAKHLLLSVLLV
jgi:hypothetical protein